MVDLRMTWSEYKLCFILFCFVEGTFLILLQWRDDVICEIGGKGGGGSLRKETFTNSIYGMAGLEDQKSF